MLKTLEVLPEHLCTTCSGLTAAQSAASSAIAAAAAAIVPAPAGADDVSLRMATLFGGFATTVVGALAGGLGNHLAGAEALVPTAATYEAADDASSSAINARRVDMA